MGRILESPDADIGHLAGTFDAFASVSQQVVRHWGDLKTMLTRLGPALRQSHTELLTPGIALFDELRAVMPMLNDLTTILTDPATGAPGLVYAPSRVAIPQEKAEQVCAAVNAVAPGQCVGAAHRMVDLNLVQLVLGMAGVR